MNDEIKYKVEDLLNDIYDIQSHNLRLKNIHNKEGNRKYYHEFKILSLKYEKAIKSLEELL
jgi:hypothetical protein